MSQSGMLTPWTPAVDQGGGDPPGPDDVEYFAAAQAGSWGDTLRAFARFAGSKPGSRVLDLGTGPGLLARLLKEGGARMVVGCDASLPMLRRALGLAQGGRAGEQTAHLQGDQASPTRPESGQANARPEVAPAGANERPDWVEGDALRLPFGDQAFDAALAANLLFLLSNPAAGLAELARVVVPGGTVEFLNPSDEMSVPAARAFMDERGVTGFDRFSFVNYARLAEENYRLSLGEWQALAEATGLRRLRHQARAGGMVLFVSMKRAPL